MMKPAGRTLGLGLLLLAVGFSSVSGQSAAQKGEGESVIKSGSLNRWTTEMVLEQRGGFFPLFLTVRFGKHRGFDRIVIELEGDSIGYAVRYRNPPFRAKTGGKIVKVRGQSFIEIALSPVVLTDGSIQANRKLVREQNRLEMPLIRDVKTAEWFELQSKYGGGLRYIIGLKRASPFRVQVFSNPTRLVVDFKH